METNPFVWAYAVYLPLTVVLTWMVARTLFKNGKVFMLDIFKGKQDIAMSTNRMFEVGFYLLNLGFALLILKIDQALPKVQTIIEVLSNKVGGFSIYLGMMLFLNLYLFFRGRRKARQGNTPPKNGPKEPPLAYYGEPAI